MTGVVERAALKWLAVLAGILVISACLQLAIRIHALEAFSELIGGQVSEAYPAPGRDEIMNGEQIASINEFLGLDRPFIPDLWPFDNESLWHQSARQYRSAPR